MSPPPSSATRCSALAKGLLAQGVRFGDRVAIMCRTRYEWTLFDFALWTIGAQVVPIYPTSSAEQVFWMLYDAECRPRSWSTRTTP